MSQITYGQLIRWTERSGDTVRALVKGCATQEEAMIECVALAKMHGWTPPKWWQWWRWSDTRLTE